MPGTLSKQLAGARFSVPISCAPFRRNQGERIPQSLLVFFFRKMESFHSQRAPEASTATSHWNNALPRIFYSTLLQPFEKKRGRWQLYIVIVLTQSLRNKASLGEPLYPLRLGFPILMWPDWYSKQITKGSSQALGFAPDPGAAAEVAMGAGINIHWEKQWKPIQETSRNSPRRNKSRTRVTRQASRDTSSLEKRLEPESENLRVSGRHTQAHGPLRQLEQTVLGLSPDAVVPWSWFMLGFWETISGWDHRGFPFSPPLWSIMTTKLFQGHSPVNAKLQFPKRPTHKEEFVHFGIQPNPLGSTTQPAPSRESKTPREGVPMDAVGSRREFSRLSSVEIVQSTL